MSRLPLLQRRNFGNIANDARKLLEKREEAAKRAEVADRIYGISESVPNGNGAHPLTKAT